jgi:hypothetical protein
MLLPFMSIIPCYFEHEQSIYTSLRLLLDMQLCWLLYFVLHRFQISEKDLFKMLIFIGSAWVALEMIQQVTYPNYYFYTRGDTDLKSIEIRAGIYRYMITGISFALLALFYYLQKIFDSDKQRVKNFSWVIFFLLGVYLYMTRQILVSVLATVFIAPLLTEKINIKKKILFFLGGIFLLGSIYLFKDVLFGELIEDTGSEVNDDNIRVSSYLFYLNYWDDWTCFIFGNGLYDEASSYGKYLSYVENDLGLWRSDVGIIGELSKYGIIYMMAYILFCFYFFRISRGIELYLKLYFIGTLFIVLMIFPFRDGSEYQLFAIFLYLCDLSIAKYSSV